VDIVLKR